MSHSYVSNRIHVVFSTRERRDLIAPDIQPKIWAYMVGIGKNIGAEVFAVGGSWPPPCKRSKAVPPSGWEILDSGISNGRKATALSASVRLPLTPLSLTLTASWNIIRSTRLKKSSGLS